MSTQDRLMQNPLIHEKCTHQTLASAKAVLEYLQCVQVIDGIEIADEAQFGY